LCAAYVFYQADRYDIKGKTPLTTQSKYDTVDSGLRELLLAGAATDIGHILENVVYLELLRRNGKVQIGRSADISTAGAAKSRRCSAKVKAIAGKIGRDKGTAK
jgi:predicted AAA+ superfamily ATPase